MSPLSAVSRVNIFSYPWLIAWFADVSQKEVFDFEEGCFEKNFWLPGHRAFRSRLGRGEVTRVGLLTQEDWRGYKRRERSTKKPPCVRRQPVVFQPGREAPGSQSCCTWPWPASLRTAGRKSPLLQPERRKTNLPIFSLVIFQFSFLKPQRLFYRFCSITFYL